MVKESLVVCLCGSAVDALNGLVRGPEVRTRETDMLDVSTGAPANGMDARGMTGKAMGVGGRSLVSKGVGVERLEIVGDL